MNDIRITKLPNIVNPNDLLKEEVKKRYGSKCPFCGEVRSIWDFSNSEEFMTKGLDIGSLHKTWYGKQCEANKFININPKYWFQKDHHWEILCCKCFTCGAEWETPPYPTDAVTQKELDSIFKNYDWGEYST